MPQPAADALQRGMSWLLDAEAAAEQRKTRDGLEEFARRMFE
jgi:hypothetical protein